MQYGNMILVTNNASISSLSWSLIFCLAHFRSIYHRVTKPEQERYSVFNIFLTCSNASPSSFQCRTVKHGQRNKVFLLMLCWFTYQVAMFFDPSPDCVVECLKSCCSESSPPRYSTCNLYDFFTAKCSLRYLHLSTELKETCHVEYWNGKTY